MAAQTSNNVLAAYSAVLLACLMTEGRVCHRRHRRHSRAAAERACRARHAAGRTL